MDPATLLTTVALPAAVALVFAFVARLARGRAPALGSGAVPALALALAVVLACRSQNSGLPWPPRIAFESLPWVAVAASLAGLLLRGGAPTLGHGELADNAAREGPGGTSALVAVVAALVGLAFLRLPGAGTETHLVGYAAAIGGAMFAARACSVPGPAAPVGVWGTAACLAGLALLAGIAKLALVCGALSAGAAALAVLSLLQRPLALGAAGAGVWSALLGAGALLGLAYDEAGVPVVAWWLIAFSPAAAALSEFTVLRRSPRMASVVRAGAPMALSAVALVIGVIATQGPGVEGTDADDAPYPYSALSRLVPHGAQCEHACDELAPPSAHLPPARIQRAWCLNLRGFHSFSLPLARPPGGGSWCCRSACS